MLPARATSRKLWCRASSRGRGSVAGGSGGAGPRPRPGAPAGAAGAAVGGAAGSCATWLTTGVAARRRKRNRAFSRLVMLFMTVSWEQGPRLLYQKWRRKGHAYASEIDGRDNRVRVTSGRDVLVARHTAVGGEVPRCLRRCRCRGEKRGARVAPDRCVSGFLIHLVGEEVARPVS